jgi:solute carrier family 25 thiamine pyrophosphate transporter 19
MIGGGGTFTFPWASLPPSLPRRTRRLVVLSVGVGLAAGEGIQRRRARAATTTAMGGGGGAIAALAASSSDRREDRRRGERRRPPPSTFTQAMAGAFAGMVSRVAVAPLDVVKIRMQVQVEPVGFSGLNANAAATATGGGGKYRGIAQCARTILREEGLRGLWAGTVPALFLWVPYTAIQFAALGEFRKVASAAGQNPTSPAMSFAGGAIAGATATVATYPFDVMRTVLAAQGSPRVYASLADAAAGIVRDRGVRGLYAGVGVTLIEIIPASAIQFGSYAAMKRTAMRWEHGKEETDHGQQPSLSGFANGACGFGAGVVARLIIHPLDVVKKRFQVAGLARSLRYGERVAMDGEAFKSIAGAMRRILAKEGVGGFYKGLTPGLIKSAPASAITFAVYEAVLRLM